MYPQYPPIATTSLYDYIYWKDYNKQINALAALTGEQWNFSSRTDNAILKNYMQQTFRKLIEDKASFKHKAIHYSTQDYSHHSMNKSMYMQKSQPYISVNGYLQDSTQNMS